METSKPKLKSRSKDVPLKAETEYYHEPTKEELLEDLRIALRDVMAGDEGMPAREAIDALQRRVYGDGHEG